PRPTMLRRSRPLAAFVLLPVLCALATSAPAPLPRRDSARRIGPWLVGWDRPAGPAGCSFERDGERLTIAAPAKLSGPRPGEAPRLMGSVRGDFIATVRVDVKELLRTGRPWHGAGLALLADQQSLWAKVEIGPGAKPQDNLCLSHSFVYQWGGGG